MFNDLCIYDSLKCLIYIFIILMVYDIDIFCCMKVNLVRLGKV